MNKRKRQQKVLELIKEFDINTQEELCEKLCEAGFDTTQATVSRDINELELYKVLVPGKGYKYATTRGANASSKNIRVLRDSVLSVSDADRIVVIKTSAGMAMAAAAAIDSVGFPELVGSIAGDDTVICAVKDTGESETLEDKLRSMLF